MALQSTRLRAYAATDVTAELELINGSKYMLQAQGGVISLTEQVEEPDPEGDAHVVLPIDTFFPFRQGDEVLYAWGDAYLVVMDAV